MITVHGVGARSLNPASPASQHHHKKGNIAGSRTTIREVIKVPHVHYTWNTPLVDLPSQYMHQHAGRVMCNLYDVHCIDALQCKIEGIPSVKCVQSPEHLENNVSFWRSLLCHTMPADARCSEAMLFFNDGPVACPGAKHNHHGDHVHVK
jgi:hypothetical protein